MISGLDIFNQVKRPTNIYLLEDQINHTGASNGIAKMINPSQMVTWWSRLYPNYPKIEVYKVIGEILDQRNWWSINFITDIDYQMLLCVLCTQNQFRNNSFDLNFTKITDNDWHQILKVYNKQ